MTIQKLKGSAIIDSSVTSTKIETTVVNKITDAYNQANSAHGQANTAYGQANSAFSAANNCVLKAGDTMTGQLNVSSSGNWQANITGTTASAYTQLYFNGSARQFGIGVGNGSETSNGLANDFFVFDHTAGATRLAIDINGNLGLGTNAPGTRLDVRGVITGGDGTIRTVISYTASAGVTGTLSDHPYVFYASNAERMRLTSTGLGISESNNPTQAFNIYRSGSTQAVMAVGNSNTGLNGAYFGVDTAGNAIVNQTQALAMILSTSAAERARILSSGEFLTGTTSAIAVAGVTGFHALSVDGNNKWAAVVRNSNGTTPFGLAINYSAAAPNGTSSHFLYCYDSGALRASIRSNGGLANFQSNNVDLSDERTKKNITPVASMWGKIGALEIVNYKYNDQIHDDMNIGVIAQQVEIVEPVWVDADGFGETPEDGVPLKTVYTKDITFAAIKALQEAMARIEQLEAKVVALESN